MPSVPTKSTAKSAAVKLVPPLRRLVERREQLAAQLTASNATAADLAAENERLRCALAGSERVSSGSTDDLEYLLVVTYGRSGSTLLQGILNSIPGYVVRGENRQALVELFRYHTMLVREKNIHAEAEVLRPHTAWYGIDEYPEARSIGALRNAVVGSVLRPNGDTRVLGFKEIRWWMDDWEQYFDFLDLLFPGFRVVLNTRDHDDVAKSKWWAHRENAHEMLERYERRLDAIEARLGDRAHRLHYDDWVGRPEVLRGLFDWLGEPFDVESIDAVMAVTHSY